MAHDVFRTVTGALRYLWGAAAVQLHEPLSHDSQEQKKGNHEPGRILAQASKPDIRRAVRGRVRNL